MLLDLLDLVADFDRSLGSGAPSLVYPFVGPLFKGTLSNEQFSLFFIQLVQGLMTEFEVVLKVASHLIFFLRHSSQALETFDLFL